VEPGVDVSDDDGVVEDEIKEMNGRELTSSFEAAE